MSEYYLNLTGYSSRPEERTTKARGGGRLQGAQYSCGNAVKLKGAS